MRAASDVGGTFTDLVYYEVDPVTGRCGEVKSTKTDTTPPRFEEGVMNALTKAGVPLAELDFFAHGSTVIINAITERKGAPTALITTAGFRDVLEIGRGNRPDLFNFRFRKPQPFVERHLRAEVRERVNYKGEIECEPDLDPLPELLEYFRAEGVEAIAVCFLYAYLNPENERHVVERIKALWPEVSVLASHRISREWREYERSNTTVLSAYVHPVARRYIESLERRLASGGYKDTLYMMQSNCGITTAAAAKANPVSMVESGPASGIHAAAWLGRAIGEPNLIVLDIGGTTAKCTLVEAGNVRVSTQYHIEKTPTDPGYPIQTPVSEIVEIGNGGGSIAWIDEGGKFHVGPQSAGAMPGPAAYGRGGTHATTTDANLVLGRIDPESFVGGEVEPDWDAVQAAFAPLTERLGVDIEEAARGVVRVANANMTNALRLISVNKGFDPREFVLVAFGGGGAMHAVALAEELRIPKVIVPANSAVFSAWGMLLTDLRRDYLLTRPLTLDAGARDRVKTGFAELADRARQDFSDSGIALGDEDAGRALVFEQWVDMRYVGQEHTVNVRLSHDAEGRPDLSACTDAFHAAHEKQFTYRLDNAVQIVNFHLVAMVEVEKPDLARRARTGRTLEDTVLGNRRVDFDQHGVHDAAIYDGLAFEPGMELTGPAVVQEPSVTLVVQPGHRVLVDDYGNYHVHMDFVADGNG
ncbi:hydantoinase/oxoprolinase family protein [Elongatibacter sediminis]|uniref:Hydantoinase/oxoprolinase family protein n=1 Tax=Elongatibacter sediminis TaxID=3119006 RepID=A0AAW9RD89_9GAMM